MKQWISKCRGVSKGRSSGLLVSLLIHFGILILAASIVCFVKIRKQSCRINVVARKERPVIKPPKLRPLIDKNVKPSRQLARITVKQAVNQDHNYSLPSVTGNAVEGDIPSCVVPSFEFEEPGNLLMGDPVGDGFGLVGTFYDFKRNRRGAPTIMDPHQFVAEVADFVRSGWKPAKLSRFYRSPKKLYASSFMIPPVKSSVAPAAFGEDETLGYCWLAHYKGQLVNSEEITFRFWGHGDDILAVRVGGEEVLVASWPGGSWGTQEALTSAADGWQSSSAKSRNYTMGNNTAVVGDWITLKANEPKDMEVILGEVPGGTFCAMLAVEVKGQHYPLNREQAPILPMFKTAEPSRDLMDNIYEWLTYDHVALTGGPVFRDTRCGSKTNILVNAAAAADAAEPAATGRQRVWMLTDGQSVAAEYVCTIGDKAVLKTAAGKQLRVKVNRLSDDDRSWIELANPPELASTFTKKSSQRMIETTPYLEEVPPRLFDYVFGAKLKQTSARAYNHPLNAELFVLGRQRIDDRKYILLDHQTSSFVPGEEEGRAYSFRGPPVEIMSYDTSQPMGRQYSDYLLIVSDLRGEIIHYSASANWLFPNLGKLRRLTVGNFLDKTCSRVYPTGPGPRSLYY